MNALAVKRASALRGRDLVVFSNDWDGDPLSKVHIMRLLSKENRVLWINSLGNRSPRLQGHDVLRILNKLRAFGRGLREVEPNIHVLSPLAIPAYGHEWIRTLNGKLLRAQVLRAMKRLEFRRPISWSFLPASAPVSGSLGEEFVIYHCVDEFSAFSDAQANHIADLENRLLRKSDLCITSAEKLQFNKLKINPHTVMVSHGVDFEHFVRACDATTPLPPDLAQLPKPIMGFFGLIADWVDLDAIAFCARAFPNGSVALLGKIAPNVNVEALRHIPNVHFLGRKPYSELPEYCRGFDVALMPFKLNELTENANPLKVREYLAAGLPVVSSNLPEVRKLGLCFLAEKPEDFPRLVKTALDHSPGCSVTRANLIAHESWAAKVEDIRRHVESEMRRRGLPL